MLRGKEILHRENGPAIIAYENNCKKHGEFYLRKGKIHRKNGPEEIYYTENGKVYNRNYYFNGVHFNAKDTKEFNKMLNDHMNEEIWG